MEFLSKGIGGIKWVSIARFSRQIIQFVTSILLARILAPEDFGLVALGLIFFGFLTTFKDFGIGSAIIYVEKFDQVVFSTAFLINFILSAFLGAITFLLASQIAWLLSPDSETTLLLLPIIQFFSILFVFNGLTSLQQSVMERELLFNKLAIIEISATIIGATTAIILAVLYANIWSLIAQISVTLFINGILVFIYSPLKPTPIFSFEKMRIIFNYSSRLSIYIFINYFVRNADYFLIGKFLGSTSLGYYSLAYRIILYPIINISNVISRVMLPIYSRMKDHIELFQTTFKTVSYFIYLIVLPYFVFLLIFSEDFVIYLLSEKWRPITDIIIVLIPAGIIQASSVTTGSIYQALGKTQTLLIWGLVSGFLFILSFVLGLQYGVVGVALCYSVVNVLLSYSWFKIPFQYINLKVYNYLLNLKNLIIISISILLVYFFIHYFLQDSIKNIFVFIIMATVLLIIYIIVYYKYLINEIREHYYLLKGKR